MTWRPKDVDLTAATRRRVHCATVSFPLRVPSPCRFCRFRFQLAILRAHPPDALCSTTASFHIAYERETTTYGHPPRLLSITTPEAFLRVFFEKLVANPENGRGRVFQNALPETIMAVLRNGPGPFRRSFSPF
jgi:hypothetical protein